MDNNAIHKATSTRGTGIKDPILTYDSKLVNKARNIKDSNIFFETSLSAQSVVVYAGQLLSAMNIDDVLIYATYINTNEDDDESNGDCD